MKRIAILTAGGDTPALNATIYGAVQRANALKVEVVGIIKGFSGVLNPKLPHVHLNPLFTSVPELDPCKGGTLLGASRDYIDPSQSEILKQAVQRLESIGIEGLICIGGDGTINGMQPLSQFFPVVLAPKTIDNDLGLNYRDEPNEWIRQSTPDNKSKYVKKPSHHDLNLEEIINYATPGYATAVWVAAHSIERIRTTAESHRRIAIVELMGRQSGYIALGSAYGQPDIILIPEVPLNYQKLEERVREIYDIQKHVVIALGEGITDETGNIMGDVSTSVDPAGNLLYNGAAEELAGRLIKSLGDHYFTSKRRHDSAKSAVFTRKVGHTQRGGRPILFDRCYAAQLGGKALELLLERANNHVSTLHYSERTGFTLGSIDANSLRDPWSRIHPRLVHPALYDQDRFQPSKLGVEYLMPIFNDAVGWDDAEFHHTHLFSPGNLTTRYQSVNVSVQKRIRYLG